jgi:dTDP-4-dehydrorhamnose reductase
VGRKSNKIVLIGENGQVGSALVKELKANFDLFIFSRKQLSKEKDLDGLDNIINRIRSYKPNIIINAVAYTDVDQAEVNTHKANLLNTHLPDALSIISNELNSLFVHFSTDYVYPGTGKVPWKESSPTNPQGCYASTKLSGDLHVLNKCNKYLIFRTSWVYSLEGNNFPNTILKIAKNKNEISIINDQIGSPTSSKFIASIVKKALMKYQQLSESHEYNGIYNLSPSGYVSWHDLADYIFERAKSYDKSYENVKLKPILSRDYDSLAKRPLNSRLDCSKLEVFLDMEMPSWKDGITHFINDKFS